MKLEWLATALADLDRFANFLHDRHPHLAKIVAAEIRTKAAILSDYSLIGRNSASWFLRCGTPAMSSAMPRMASVL
jgi:plasmid stabilization system protein ParE